jgi:phenylpropionate dioxygenase-like ring-hydroxylating dioxygenase large terminal subunit
MHANIDAVIERAVARAEDPIFASPERRVAIDRYLDAGRAGAEIATLFHARPTVVAHASEVATAGACLPRRVAGRSILLVRDAAGALRAFLNACGHRGTRLCAEPATNKALVCPYHGWTYTLDGRLRHAPRAECFPSLRDGNPPQLVELPVAVIGGLVFVTPTPGAPDVATTLALGPIEDELRSLELAAHVVFRRATSSRRANWKLIIEAFLEAYHIRTLHRDTIYPFFLDCAYAAERVGAHIRSATSRRGALEPDRPWRERVTLTYFLFPSTIVAFHPDYVSVIVVTPEAPDRLGWAHTMLLRDAPRDDRQAAHFARSFELIEERVFQKEDLAIAEEMQEGIASRSLSHVTFGALEEAAGWFHDAVDAALPYTSSDPSFMPSNKKVER